VPRYTEADGAGGEVNNGTGQKEVDLREGPSGGGDERRGMR
jgi:hypothetical protein